jgi:hypothetical protein
VSRKYDTEAHALADEYSGAERLAIQSEPPLESTPRPLLVEVPMSDLATVEPVPVRFVVEPVLPRRFVTLLAGHGDAGKTLLALTIAAHVACGRRFADLPCITGRVLFVSLEDEGTLIKLRLRRIAEAYGLDAAAVAANVTVLEVNAGMDDAALAVENVIAGMRHLVFTTTLEQIKVRAAGHDLIVIDNASDAYDADENVRRLVRRFVRELQRIGRDHQAAVLLLAHIDKAGARNGTAGETYSGSTAWHNSVRSRLALVDDGKLELRHEKHNVTAGLRHPIEFERNEHGVPVPVSRAQIESNERADVRAVLAAVRGAIADDITVPTAVSGPKTTLHLLSGRPELPEDLAENGKRVRAALIVLEREGSIWRETYRTADRNERERYQCVSSSVA